MDIRELYSGLRRIQNRGETGNAYGGCGTVDEDRDVQLHLRRQGRPGMGAPVP